MSEKAPANVMPQASTKSFAQPRSGGKWIRYLVACSHVLQSLVSIGQDVPAVMYALAQGHQGKSMRLLVDVLLFALSVGMAAVADASLPTPPADSGIISDGEDEEMTDAVEGSLAHTPVPAEGTPKGKDDDEAEQGTGGGLDLVGGVLRCISMLLRTQWRAEAEGLGDAQTGKKRKKSWGAAGSGAAVLFVGDTTLKKLMVNHVLMPRTLVATVLDALAAVFRELDISSGPRRKNLLLYVAGAMETLFVLRFVHMCMLTCTCIHRYIRVCTHICRLVHVASTSNIIPSAEIRCIFWSFLYLCFMLATFQELC